jgi:hypothetical protein
MAGRVGVERQEVPLPRPDGPGGRRTRVLASDSIRCRIRTMDRLTRGERVRGAVWGLLIGDAVGVPYEFHEPEDLLWCDQVEMTPPSGLIAHTRETPPGTWSDDGAHALCRLASLPSAGGGHSPKA